MKHIEIWFHVSFRKTCVLGGESKSHEVADPPPEAGRAWRAPEDAQAQGVADGSKRVLVGKA